MSYDPHSPDSMFSRIMEKLEHQDRVLADIKEQTGKTKDDVDVLQHEKWYQRGVIAGISLAISAAYSYFFKS